MIMERARLLREILAEGKSLTKNEIVDIIKSQYPEEWAEKERYYLSDGKDEKFVCRQIGAEINSSLTDKKGGWVKLGRVTRKQNTEGVWVYTITPEYFNFLRNQTFRNEFLDEEPQTNEIDESNEEFDNFSKDWFVYLMKSNEFEGVFKIGYTDNLERRQKELISPSNKVYNVFDFRIKFWVKIDTQTNMKLMEDTLHAYFHIYRKWKKNGNSINTEIFVHPEMEKFFLDFVLLNYITNDHYKSKVLNFKLDS